MFLPQADAVVGNPPYVRQEDIGSENKERYAQVATAGLERDETFGPERLAHLLLASRLPAAQRTAAILGS